MLGNTTVHLGLSPESFWKLTPHELFAAFEAKSPEIKEKREGRKRLEELKKAEKARNGNKN